MSRLYTCKNILSQHIIFGFPKATAVFHPTWQFVAINPSSIRHQFHRKKTDPAVRPTQIWRGFLFSAKRSCCGFDLSFILVEANSTLGLEMVGVAARTRGNPTAAVVEPRMRWSIERRIYHFSTGPSI